MASPPLLSDSNWMGANINQSRINPSLRGANSSAASADPKPTRLSSSAPVVIIEVVFMLVISSPLVVVFCHGQNTPALRFGYTPACWAASLLSPLNIVGSCPGLGPRACFLPCSASGTTLRLHAAPGPLL